MAGHDLSVTCNFVAIPEPDVVVWRKNRKTVQESDRVKIEETDTSTTLTVTKATHDDSGRYTLQVENDLGSDDAAIYVSVLGKTRIPIPEQKTLHVLYDFDFYISSRLFKESDGEPCAISYWSGGGGVGWDLKQMKYHP